MTRNSLSSQYRAQQAVEGLGAEGSAAEELRGSDLGFQLQANPSALSPLAPQPLTFHSGLGGAELQPLSPSALGDVEFSAPPPLSTQDAQAATPKLLIPRDSVPPGGEIGSADQPLSPSNLRIAQLSARRSSISSQPQEPEEDLTNTRPREPEDSPEKVPEPENKATTVLKKARTLVMDLQEEERIEEPKASPTARENQNFSFAPSSANGQLDTSEWAEHSTMLDEEDTAHPDPDNFPVVSAKSNKSGRSRKANHVILALSKATGLRKADLLGKSDPYVKIFLVGPQGKLNEVGQSSVRWRTLDPLWNEEFELFKAKATHELLIEVWDKDSWGNDDFLGEVMVDLADVFRPAIPDTKEHEYELDLLTNSEKSNALAKGKIVFAIKESDARASAKLWVKPSLEQAQDFQCKARPYKFEGEAPPHPHSMSTRIISEGHLGEGIALWINFTFQMFLLFFFLFIINGPAFVFYMYGPGLPEDAKKGQGILAVPSLGNFFSEDQIQANLDPSNENERYMELKIFGKTRSFDRKLMTILFPGLDLLSTLIFLLFFWWTSRVQAIRVRKLKAQTLTCGDYAVMVTGISGKSLTMEDLKHYMQSNFGKVSSVTLAKYKEIYLKVNSWSRDVNEQIGILERTVAKHQQLAAEKSEQHPLYWVTDAHPKLKGRQALATRQAIHMKLVYDLEMYRKKLDKLHEDLENNGASDDTYAAFVVFEEQKFRDACIEAKQLLTWFRCGTSEKDPKFQSMVVTEAPEPTNVLWENLQYGRKQRTVRSCLIGAVVVVLLIASFAGILQAQVYQRNHPLPSCPPTILESAVDTESRDYFSNKLPGTWGPGARNSGISPLLDANEGTFAELRVCMGGTLNSGRSCITDDDCDSPAKCLTLDLSCSYKDDLAQADTSGSNAEKGRLLDERFVIDPESANTTGLKWDSLGQPPFCDGARYVLRPVKSESVLVVEGNATNVTSPAMVAGDYEATGVLKNSTCDSLLTLQCIQPAANCTEYPGCTYATWPNCENASLINCEVEVTMTNSSDNTLLSIQQFSTNGWVNNCGQDSGVSCTFKAVARFQRMTTHYQAWPTYFATVCDRYKTECSACFCVDTLGQFWTVWLFSLSSGYSDLCSTRFQELFQEISLFIVAVISVVLVNMAAKFILRSLAFYEKIHTISGKERAIALKVFLAQFFNTAFIPLLVYARVEYLSETQCRGGRGRYDPSQPESTFGFNGMPCTNKQTANGQPVCFWGGGTCSARVPDSFPMFAGEFPDFENLWYSTVGAGIVVTVIINTLLALLPVLFEMPFQKLNEVYMNYSAVTQKQLNKTFAGPEFELAARYGVFLSTIFVCMIYSSAVPALYFVASIFCLFTFLADKYSLLRLYQTPPRYDDKLALLALRIMPISGFLHLCFGVWQYSALFPLIPVWSFVTEEVVSALDKDCLASSDPFKCEWSCTGGTRTGSTCGNVANNTLFVNYTHCELGGGECHGTEQSLLQFNFAIRLTTWSTAPHVIVITLLILLLVFHKIVLNFPIVGHILNAILRACPTFCRAREEGDQDFPCYTTALAKKPPVESNPKDAENTLWQGPRNYNITKIARYREAFDESGGGEIDSYTWISDEVKSKVPDSMLANTLSDDNSESLGSPPDFNMNSRVGTEASLNGERDLKSVKIDPLPALSPSQSQGARGVTGNSEGVRAEPSLGAEGPARKGEC